METCSVCGNDELTGDLGVIEQDLGDEGFVIAIVETSPRNWILCDSCNALVCHRCCSYPRTGYCDTCISKYDLYSLVRDVYGTFPTI